MKCLLAVVLFPVVAFAQKPPAGCPLLTASEISAATGMKVGESHEVDMQLPKGQGEMTGCMWKLGEHGMVNISVLPASPSKEERERGLAKLRQVYSGLRAKGWTVTESKFGDTLCNRATPPAAESGQSPAMTGCFAMSKGFVYSVGIMGPHLTTPAEKAKALTDRIAKRLP